MTKKEHIYNTKNMCSSKAGVGKLFIIEGRMGL